MIQDEDVSLEVLATETLAAGATTNNNQQQDFLLDDDNLPPTKIKRLYKCPDCTYTTFNPRSVLRHRKEIHGHKVRIVECPFCLYACQYRQKLNRHLRLVHQHIPNGSATSKSRQVAPQSSSRAQSSSRGDQMSLMVMARNGQSSEQQQLQLYQNSMNEPNQNALIGTLQLLASFMPHCASQDDANYERTTPKANSEQDDIEHCQPLDLSFPAERKLYLKMQAVLGGCRP